MFKVNPQKFGAEGQPFTVFIEGNIGSGKTTFLNHFKRFNEVCLQSEPVDQWRNVSGVNLLVTNNVNLQKFLLIL